MPDLVVFTQGSIADHMEYIGSIDNLINIGNADMSNNYDTLKHISSKEKTFKISEYNGTMQTTYMNLGTFFKKYFDYEIVNTSYPVYWAGIFSIKRHVIKKHPKRKYKFESRGGTFF